MPPEKRRPIQVGKEIEKYILLKLVKKMNIQVNSMKQESVRELNSIMRVLAQELEAIAISLHRYQFQSQSSHHPTLSFKEKESAIKQKRYKLLSQFAKLALNFQDVKIPTFYDFNDLFTPQKERYCRFSILFHSNLLIEDAISMTAKSTRMQILTTI